MISKTKISPNLNRNVQTLLTWGGPPMVIPALRFFQDDPKDRKELFIRDFGTYSIGTIVFFSAKIASNKILKKTNLVKDKELQDLISFSTALISNFLYAGIGAVKISKLIAKLKSEKKTIKQKKNSKINILLILELWIP